MNMQEKKPVAKWVWPAIYITVGAIGARVLPGIVKAVFDASQRQNEETSGQGLLILAFVLTVIAICATICVVAITRTKNKPHKTEDSEIPKDSETPKDSKQKSNTGKTANEKVAEFISKIDSYVDFDEKTVNDIKSDISDFLSDLELRELGVFTPVRTLRAAISGKKDAADIESARDTAVSALEALINSK